MKKIKKKRLLEAQEGKKKHRKHRSRKEHRKHKHRKHRKHKHRHHNGFGDASSVRYVSVIYHIQIVLHFNHIASHYVIVLFMSNNKKKMFCKCNFVNDLLKLVRT